MCHLDETSPDDVKVECSEDMRTELKEDNTTFMNSSKKQIKERSSKLKYFIRMAKSQMKYIVWQRLLVLICLILIGFSVFMRSFYDDSMASAFESHSNIFQMGSFIRALSYTIREASKYKLNTEYPGMNFSNYLDGKYYQASLMLQYNVILKNFLVQIIKFSNEERLRLNDNGIGSLDIDSRID